MEAGCGGGIVEGSVEVASGNVSSGAGVGCGHGDEGRGA